MRRNMFVFEYWIPVVKLKLLMDAITVTEYSPRSIRLLLFSWNVLVVLLDHVESGYFCICWINLLTFFLCFSLFLFGCISGLMEWKFGIQPIYMLTMFHWRRGIVYYYYYIACLHWERICVFSRGVIYWLRQRKISTKTASCFQLVQSSWCWYCF